MKRSLLLNRSSVQTQECLREIILKKHKVDIEPYIGTRQYDDDIKKYCSDNLSTAQQRANVISNCRDLYEIPVDLATISYKDFNLYKNNKKKEQTRAINLLYD